MTDDNPGVDLMRGLLTAMESEEDEPHTVTVYMPEVAERVRQLVAAGYDRDEAKMKALEEAIEQAEERGD